MSLQVLSSDISWKIGCHVPLTSTIYETVYGPIHNGCYSFQFFLGSPQLYDRRRVADDDLNRAKKILRVYKTDVFSHACYKYNLCGRKGEVFKKGDSLARTVKRELEYELGIIAELGEYSDKSGVVIHPGIHIKKNRGLRSISKFINKLEFPHGSTLILENAAGEGCKLASTIDEIRIILEGLNSTTHIGVCLDTAHLHGEGTYDLRTMEGVEKVFSDFEDQIHLDKLTVSHLNDSLVNFGSRVDRHAMLCNGKIWTDNEDPVVRWLDLCADINTPIILETTPLDLLVLLDLHNRHKE